jgi:hypothetical protein
MKKLLTLCAFAALVVTAGACNRQTCPGVGQAKPHSATPVANRA